MKKGILILPLILVVLSSLVMGSITFRGLTPDDEYKTSDQTPEICFRPITNESSITNATLWISDYRVGYTATVTNNTEVCMTSNKSLDWGTAYSWKFQVGDNDGASTPHLTNSTARTITATRLGSAIQILGETVGIFAPVVLVVIGILVLLLGIAVFVFVMKLIDGILGMINKKVKGT